MSEKGHCVTVKKVSPKRTVLHENSYGIQAVRIDYAKRSKVIYEKEKCVFISYRFDKVTPVYESQYLSWANLDCCGGWDYDESYLRTAVQNGHKLYAGCYFYANQYGTPEQTRQEIERIFRELPDNCIGGYEPAQSERVISFYICRKGCLEDYYDIDAALDYYERLGVWIDAATRKNVKYLSTMEICRYGQPNPPVDYLCTYSLVSAIITGLLLGYPIESTASFLLAEQQ